MKYLQSNNFLLCVHSAKGHQLSIKSLYQYIQNTFHVLFIIFLRINKYIPITLINIYYAVATTMCYIAKTLAVIFYTTTTRWAKYRNKYTFFFSKD